MAVGGGGGHYKKISYLLKFNYQNHAIYFQVGRFYLGLLFLCLFFFKVILPTEYHLFKIFALPPCSNDCWHIVIILSVVTRQLLHLL